MGGRRVLQGDWMEDEVDDDPQDSDRSFMTRTDLARTVDWFSNMDFIHSLDIKGAGRNEIATERFSIQT